MCTYLTFSLDNLIQNNKQTVIEGQLRVKELCDHLERINANKMVFLSEDGSGIVQKICYDAKSNQLVGLVLPLQETNGCPKLFSYVATSEEEIRQFMDLPQASLVYIIAAQPLQKGAPPFILQVFGTNNKFTAKEVLVRWSHIEIELKK